MNGSFIKIIILILFLTAVSQFLFSEDKKDQPLPGAEQTQIKPAPKTEEKKESLYEQTLRLDIDSSTYYELYAWCKQIGIDTSGDVNQLKSKLYQYFKIKEITPPSPEQKEDTVKNLETSKPPEVIKTGTEKKASKIIIIKSANDSEYLKIEDINEKYLYLKGNVYVQVVDKDQDVIHEIMAHRIILNQTENFITAQENVTYSIIRGKNQPEVFKGESFSFNLNTWEGVFFKGSGTSSGEVKQGQSIQFTFYGDTISRLSNDTVILDNGGVTSSRNKEDPYWQIKAQKIIILAPGEWTISNAILCIGRVPMLYIPFFFYPGDEIFFSPVIGYRNREGNFIQTTTYFIGVKEKKKSPFSFLRATEDVQTSGSTEIKGLFLRRVKEKRANPLPKDWILKLMIDYYSRLGGFAGISMNFPPAIKLNGSLGISRSIFPNSNSYGNYTVFYQDSSGNYKDYWNSSSYFGIPLPIRYGFDSTFNYNFFDSALVLSGNIEMYSDPYFSYDFYNRSEDIDFSKLLGMSQADITPTQTTATEKIQFVWSMKTIFNLNKYMPAPLISKLQSDYLNLELSWQSKDSPPDLGYFFDSVNPARKFYYPDRLTFPNVKLTIEGDLLRLSSQSIPGKDDKKNILVDPGKGVRSPAEIIGEEKAAIQEQNQTEQKPDIVIPEMKSDIQNPIFRSLDSSFALMYSIVPQGIVEYQFDNKNWDTSNKIDLSTLYTHFVADIPLSITAQTMLLGNLLNIENKFTAEGSYRNRFNRSSDVNDSDWYNLLETDYINTFSKFSTSQTITVKPFLDLYDFKNTILTYRLNWIYYEYIYSPNTSQSPYFYWSGFEWKTDTVPIHSIDASIVYQTDSKPATLHVTSTILPVFPKVDATLVFYTWLLQTSVENHFWQNSSDNSWVFNPLILTESLDLGAILFFSQQLRYNYQDNTVTDMTSVIKLWKIDSTSTNYLLEQELVYDPKVPEFTKSRSTFSLFGFKAEFMAEKLIPIYFDTNPQKRVWVQNTSAGYVFNPNYLSFKYTSKVAQFSFWKERVFVDANVDTNLIYYFQKFTDSSFKIKFTLNFEIAEFVKLVFSANSSNSNIYRYFPGVPEKVEYQWINPFVDLLHSFNFFNEQDRRISNFKIDDLSLSFIHQMYDWDLAFTFSGSYQQDATAQNWTWTPVFTISIKWQDIPEMKKEMRADNSGFNTLL